MQTALMWIRPLMRAVATLVLRRPGLVVVLGVTIPLLLSLLILTSPVDLSLLGTLDREMPLIKQYLRITEGINPGGRLLILIEGEEKRLDDVVAKVENYLSQHNDVERVVSKQPTAFFEKNLPYLVSRTAFDAWLRTMTHPDDDNAAKTLEAEFDRLKAETELYKAKGARLVAIKLKADPLGGNFLEGGYAYLVLEADLDKFVSSFDVDVSFAGLIATASQDQVQTLNRVQGLTPIGIIAVLLLLLFVERRWFRLLSVATPMALAAGAAIGLCGALSGVITVIEAFFGVLIFGLGVDFAFHLMVRLREERSEGRSFDDALRATLEFAGPGIIAGALTTSGAFFILILLPDVSMRHLGMLGFFGLTICLTLMLTLLPALWVIDARRENAAPSGRHTTAVEIPGIRAISHFSARHPVSVLVVAAALAIFAAVGTPRFHFETDFAKAVNRNLPALDVAKRVSARFNINEQAWAAEIPNYEDAVRVTEAFRQQPRVKRTAGIVDVIPPDGADRQKAIVAATEEIEAQRLTLEGLLPLVSDEEREQMELVLKGIGLLNKAAAAGPPTIDSLPAGLRDELITHDGAVRVFAFFDKTTMEANEAKRQRESLQAIWPETSTFAVLYEAILLGSHEWAFPALMAIVFFVLFVLAADQRRVRWAILAATPVFFSSLTTFGLWCWTGKPFQFMSFIAIPLIVGLGVDDGIHVVHRLRERDNLSVVEAPVRVGRAIVMTTASTCASIVAFLFSNHAGMEAMASVLIIGLPLALMASISLVPALAVVIGLKPKPDE